MTLIVAQSVGVDISKDSLDAHLHPAGRRRRFSNDAKGCAALIAWLGDVTVARIALADRRLPPRLRGLDVVRGVRPAFEDFYQVLEPDQQAALDRLMRGHRRPD